MNESFSTNLEIRDTKTSKGTGLFAKVAFPAKTVILEFGGVIYNKTDVKMPKDAANYLQIGEETYFGLSGDMDDYINHSCAPNCGLRILGRRALLITLWEINPGTEITFDYSTSCNETKEEWQLKCDCKAFNCRGIISGYQYLDAKTKEFYESRKVVPDYLIGK